jgi:hypothetical protein
MAQKKAQKPIEVKYEGLEQYDTSGSEDFMSEKEEDYSQHIGLFLMRFSTLEHTLDVEIANLISDRSHDDGYTIIKDLELFAKIELFYNLAFPRVSYAYKRKQQKTNNLNSIRKKIENITVLRNKIAHAKWYTLDKEGYVRVDMKTSKEDGVIKFRKFKMTPALIRKGIRDIEALDEKLSLFVEDNVWG